MEVKLKTTKRKVTGTKTEEKLKLKENRWAEKIR